MRNSLGIMGGTLLVVSLVAAGGALAKGKSAHDLSVKFKVGDVTTLGPEARIKVKNRGSSDENGVLVRVLADSLGGDQLWSETVDIPAGKSAKLSARVYPETDASLLVVDVQPSGADDEKPMDNEARVALWVKGGSAKTLAGRALHLMNCAECHGEDAGGGTAPSLVGARTRTLYDAAHADEQGAHGFPWMSKGDAKCLSRFYKAPGDVVLPPEPPTPPEGGWPGYETDIRPLLQDKCSNCHTTQIKGGVGLGSYRGASTNAARALGAIKRGRMPPGGRVDAVKVELLENWILGGKRP